MIFVLMLLNCLVKISWRFKKFIKMCFATTCDAAADVVYNYIIMYMKIYLNSYLFNNFPCVVILDNHLYTPLVAVNIVKSPLNAFWENQSSSVITVLIFIDLF